jgi:hypothetical protein
MITKPIFSSISPVAHPLTFGALDFRTSLSLRKSLGIPGLIRGAFFPAAFTVLVFPVLTMLTSFPGRNAVTGQQTDASRKILFHRAVLSGNGTRRG